MKAIEPIYLKLAESIRSRRRWLRLSQDQLADKCGLTRTSIVNIEAGRQRVMIHTLDQLATALGGTMINLLSEEVRGRKRR